MARKRKRHGVIERKQKGQEKNIDWSQCKRKLRQGIMGVRKKGWWKNKKVGRSALKFSVKVSRGSGGWCKPNRCVRRRRVKKEKCECGWYCVDAVERIEGAELRQRHQIGVQIGDMGLASLGVGF